MRRAFLLALGGCLVGGLALESRAQDYDRQRDGGSGSEELKVRILDMNEKKGRIVVDVAGRRQELDVEDRSMMGRFEEGDLAIITVRRRSGRSLVVDMRSASVKGRVVEVNDRHGEVVISVNGDERTYTVDRPRMLEGLKRGDRIRFEFEDRRNGRKVITAIF